MFALVLPVSQVQGLSTSVLYVAFFPYTGKNENAFIFRGRGFKEPQVENVEDPFGLQGSRRKWQRIDVLEIYHGQRIKAPLLRWEEEGRGNLYAPWQYIFFSSKDCLGDTCFYTYERYDVTNALIISYILNARLRKISATLDEKILYQKRLQVINDFRSELEDTPELLKANPYINLYLVAINLKHGKLEEAQRILRDAQTRAAASLTEKRIYHSVHWEHQKGVSSSHEEFSTFMRLLYDEAQARIYMGNGSLEEVVEYFKGRADKHLYARAWWVYALYALGRENEIPLSADFDIYRQPDGKGLEAAKSFINDRPRLSRLYPVMIDDKDETKVVP